MDCCSLDVHLIRKLSYFGYNLFSIAQCAQSRNLLIYQFCLKGTKPFFVTIHTLFYAKMPNRAIWGLLNVVGDPAKLLLCAYFKSQVGKIHILTSISGGVSKLQNGILTKNSLTFAQTRTRTFLIKTKFIDFEA